MKKFGLVRFIVFFLLISGIIFSGSIPYAAESSSTESTVKKSADTQESFFLDEYEEPEVTHSNRSLGGTLFDFAWKLVIVIVILYLFVRFLKYLYSKKMIIPDVEDGNFYIIETFYIKPNQALYLMKIAEKYLVLGVTNNNISVVTEITEQDQIDSLLKKRSSSGGEKFKSTLSSILKSDSSLDEKFSRGSRTLLDQINKISRG